MSFSWHLHSGCTILIGRRGSNRLENGKVAQDSAAVLIESQASTQSFLDSRLSHSKHPVSAFIFSVCELVL